MHHIPVVFIICLCILMRESTAESYRVLSLKNFQRRLQECSGKNGCSEQVRQCAGISSVHGYVVHPEANDILILGRVSSGGAPLRADDLVVAFRAAFRVYVENNIFTPPGCSIDPNPSTMKQLREISLRYSKKKDDSKYGKYEQAWNRVCSRPQTVRVLGIPFHSNFASVLVNADYDMKRIVDGSDSTGIEGMPDMISCIVEETREAFEKGERRFRGGSLLNRFWFYPGEYRFTEKNGAVKIDSCPVVLLTENQHLARNGESVGTGKTDPYARRIAEAFTRQFDSIAQRRPIYGHLESLLRLYVLAEVIHYREVYRAAELNLDYLLESHQVERVEVETALPGRSRFHKETFTREIPGGTEQLTLCSPICGGVLFTVKLKEEHFYSPEKDELESVRRVVQDAYPEDEGAIFYDVEIE
jgi:hypothetical protein